MQSGGRRGRRRSRRRAAALSKRKTRDVMRREIGSDDESVSDASYEESSEEDSDERARRGTARRPKRKRVQNSENGSSSGEAEWTDFDVDGPEEVKPKRRRLRRCGVSDSDSDDTSTSTRSSSSSSSSDTECDNDEAEEDKCELRCNERRGDANFDASEASLDPITREKLEHPHLDWISPDASLKMCYNLSTILSIAKTKGMLMQPPHFRSPMSADMKEQLSRKFPMRMLLRVHESEDGGASIADAVVLENINSAFDRYLRDNEAMLDEWTRSVMDNRDLVVCPLCWHYACARCGLDLEEARKASRELNETTKTDGGGENAQSAIATETDSRDSEDTSSDENAREMSAEELNRLYHVGARDDPLNIITARGLRASALALRRTNAKMKAHLHETHGIPRTLLRRKSGIDALLQQQKLRSTDGLIQHFVHRDGAYSIQSYWLADASYNRTVYNEITYWCDNLEEDLARGSSSSDRPLWSSDATSDSNDVADRLLGALGIDEEDERDRRNLSEDAEAGLVQSYTATRCREILISLLEPFSHDASDMRDFLANSDESDDDVVSDEASKQHGSSRAPFSSPTTASLFLSQQLDSDSHTEARGGRAVRLRRDVRRRKTEERGDDEISEKDSEEEEEEDFSEDDSEDDEDVIIIPESSHHPLPHSRSGFSVGDFVNIQKKSKRLQTSNVASHDAVVFEIRPGKHLTVRFDADRVCENIPWDDVAKRVTSRSLDLANGDPADIADSIANAKGIIPANDKRRRSMELTLLRLNRLKHSSSSASKKHASSSEDLA